jgi:hypothetical protein
MNARKKETSVGRLKTLGQERVVANQAAQSVQASVTTVQMMKKTADSTRHVVMKPNRKSLCEQAHDYPHD